MIYYKIETEQQAKDLLKIMPDVIAVDTEFVKGDPRTTELLSVIVADSDHAWAINPSLLPLLTTTIRTRKCVFLQDYNHCDTIILLKHGCDLRETSCHNLIDMHHLIDENAPHDLGNRVMASFGDNYKSKFWDKYKNYEDASEDEALEYACKDAIYTYRLGIEDLKNINLELYSNVIKLSKALLDTELNGLCVNQDLMKATYNNMKKDIDEWLPKLRREFNEQCETWELEEWAKEIDKRSSERGKLGVKRPTFSFASDKQIRWLVYEALKCPVISKTKTGNPSTDFETLQTISTSEPRIRSIVSYKDVKSLFSTFVEGMLERVDNGKIYPHFNVSGTSTGRLSHSNPNMGNLPKTGVIRNFFIPSPGMFFIGADYSQLEVLIEANLTEDTQLLKIINEGASKHDITAQGLSISRENAKTLNFALQYGAGSGKVAKILNIPKQEAEEVFDRYWKLYSGVKNLKEKTCKTLRETGKVTNLAGRVRHFPRPINKYEGFTQERQAYNFLIQGLAAEVCNRAFYRFSEWLKETGNGRALFSVHDEILCEVWGKDPQLPYFCMKELEECMENSTKDFNFKYPLKAVAYGPLDKWEKT